MKIEHLALVMYGIIVLIGVVAFKMQSKTRANKSLQTKIKRKNNMGIDTYLVPYGSNIIFKYISVEGKVFYDRTNNTIIDGNDLVELGDL